MAETTRVPTEEAAIAAAKARAESEGYIPFDGQNCDDYGGEDCAGWDGESGRCDCGNRRVCWETYGTPEGFYAIAVAY
jgi:hypothetical protein